ncbi:MAG: phosphopentomutase [Oscillospiraceae bacterium]
MNERRIFLMVLDSFGVGALPDAADYGDAGSNTLRAVAAAGVSLPNMARLGLGNLDGVDCLPRDNAPLGAFARLSERSKGKDTTIGHWEIAGVVSPSPMPVYPNGFPKKLLAELSAQINRKSLCNKPYSGTEVIRDYGREHLETGSVIVYTSADSVMQIAAHEDKIPLEELYQICRIARALLTGEHAVGRVIARPFSGTYPDFVRTGNRRDFSLPPPKPTLLDHLCGAGRDVIAVGKISDIFAGRGMTQTIVTHGNADGLAQASLLLERDFNGLCFINLVDFDMLYGHRNDPKGYALALERFDRWLGGALPLLRPEDVMMITADHGCDPSTPSTDHSREYVPLLIAGAPIRPTNLGTRGSFADIAATILELLGVAGTTDGESFSADIEKEIR